MSFNFTTSVAGGNTRTLTITDVINVDSEAGHGSNLNWGNSYMIQIKKDSVEQAVLSDIAGADAGASDPGDNAGDYSSDPFSMDNTYVVTEDGRYVVRTINIPVWSEFTSYTYSASNPVYVYDYRDSGDYQVYQLIDDSSGNEPNETPAEWTLVGELDPTAFDTIYGLLPSKYVYESSGYSSVDAEALWADMVYRVHTEQGLIGDDVNSLMNNREWKDSAALFLELRALPAHITNLNYEAIDDIFTRAAALLTKYS